LVASEPVRTCIGCRARAAKRELVRVTVGSDPHGRLVVVPDPQGTAPGRGAHLHPTVECYEFAVRKKAFGRALRIATGRASGNLDSVAVSGYITARDQTQQTEDREEGWSSGS
jgi:predicted RNA-binding protein YlxR (DUF448 family)